MSELPQQGEAAVLMDIEVVVDIEADGTKTANSSLITLTLLHTASISPRIIAI